MESVSDKARDLVNMLRESGLEVMYVGKLALQNFAERIDANMDDRLNVWSEDE